MKLSQSEQLNKQSKVIKKLKECGSLDESLINFGVSKHYHTKWMIYNFEYRKQINQLLEFWSVKFFIENRSGRNYYYQQFLESLNFSEQLEIYKNVGHSGKNYSRILTGYARSCHNQEKWDLLFEDEVFWKWLINQDIAMNLRRGDLELKAFKENQTSFGEEITRFIFESIFSKSFPSQSPFFLGWKEIDGLNTELNLGFEHQGPFHDANHKFYREGQKESDEYKKELSKSYGITIIQIPCIKKTKKSVLDAFYYILNEMERLNIHYPLLDLTTNQYYNKMYEIEDKLKTLDLGKMKNLPTRLLDCYNFNYLNILSFDEKQNISINYSNFESLLERTKKYRFCYGSELMNEIIQRERFLDLHSSKIIKVA